MSLRKCEHASFPQGLEEMSKPELSKTDRAEICQGPTIISIIIIIIVIVIIVIVVVIIAVIISIVIIVIVIIVIVSLSGAPVDQSPGQKGCEIFAERVVWQVLMLISTLK